jgi:hypothetical protein
VSGLGSSDGMFRMRSCSECDRWGCAHLFRPTYPDFLHGAPPTSACAAFVEESRMEFANAGNSTGNPEYAGANMVPSGRLNNPRMRLISANLFGMFFFKLSQNRHPERSASQIHRVTQRLWRGVEGPRGCLSYPCRSELFNHRSPNRADPSRSFPWAENQVHEKMYP